MHDLTLIELLHLAADVPDVTTARIRRFLYGAIRGRWGWTVREGDDARLDVCAPDGAMWTGLTFAALVALLDNPSVGAAIMP
ncbi:MAG: hypothetical protein H6738_01320 [Alphaproteobacteria bacterium]|nr:hypothetical protein [Alphaproteobacteria bacterium]MCB9695407.1 hypothetical protein [Alphaproteobacteria bacterium]